MTFQEIQTLIAELDRILAADVPTATEQQTAIEKARSALVSLRNQQADVTPPEPRDLQPGERDTADAIAQAVMAQLNRQRADWLQPLQQEIETLRQQRRAIARDVQRLEGQQTQLISNFLQVLLGRCSDSLRRHIARTLQDFEAQLLATQREAVGNPKTPNTPTDLSSPLKQLERLEQLRALEQQADALVGSLDTTFRSVFNSLERDLQGYQQSLTQAVARMHDLGLQSEVVLHRYVEQRREPTPLAASPLEMPLHVERGQRPLEPLLPEAAPPADEIAQQAEPPRVDAAEPTLYPFAGVELGSASETAKSASANDASIADRSTDPSVVNELFAIDLAPNPLADRAAQGETWDEWDEQLFTTDLPVEALPAAVPEPLILTAPLPAADASAAGIDSLMPVRLEDALFDSERDPAIAPTERELDAPLATNLPLETALFGDPAAAAEPALESATTEAEPKDFEVVAATVGDVKETIASLSELLDQVYQAQAEVAAEIAAETDEVEDYMPAAANEVLLAVDASDAPPVAEWEEVLDAEQIRQLDEDLASFGRESQTAAPVRSPAPGPARREPRTSVGSEAAGSEAAGPEADLELDESPFAPLPHPQGMDTLAPTLMATDRAAADAEWMESNDPWQEANAAAAPDDPDTIQLSADEPELAPTAPRAEPAPEVAAELTPWPDAEAAPAIAAELTDWTDETADLDNHQTEPVDARSDWDVFDANPEDAAEPSALDPDEVSFQSSSPAPAPAPPVPVTPIHPEPVSSAHPALEIAAPEDDADLERLDDATVISSIAELTDEPW